MFKNYEDTLRIGLKKVTERKYNEGKNFFLKLIEIDNARYEGHLNLSNILVLENKKKEAIETLQNYLSKNQSHPEIINGLAINFFNSNYYDKLIEHVDLYIKKNDNYLLNYLKGFCLNNSYKTSDAEIYLKKSIDLNSTFWPSHELLFKIYDLRTKILEMKNLIEFSKTFFLNNIKFKYFQALYNFRISNFKICYDILNTKEMHILLKKNKPDYFYVDYYDLLSRNYEKLYNYKKCLEYALIRNKTSIELDSNKGFNKQDLLDTISTYTKFYEKQTGPSIKSNLIGLDHSNLTFLIGFPRSGTTLLDTILRSHSKTQVIEEKPYLLNIRHEFFKKNNLSNLLDLDEDYKIQLQEKYFKSFNYDSKKTVIDKFPLNLIELGFIKTIFPNAKIVLAVRHPLDCILSCVLTAFKINEAMLNFENLKTTAFFYNKIFYLLYKYIEFFNIELHQIKYENVVLDFDSQIKKLLSFLELEYENSILKFYDTAKKREKIHTPSYHQVVKPLYSQSINRHLSFEDVNTVVPDIEKWIKHFLYKNPIY